MLDRPAEVQAQEKGEESHPVLSTSDGQRFLLTPRAGRNVGALELVSDESEQLTAFYLNVTDTAFVKAILTHLNDAKSLSKLHL